MSAPTGGPSLSQDPNLVTNSNNPSNQQPTLFPISAKPQIPPPQRRQLDNPSDSFITRIVQTVTLVHYIDGDGNPRGMSTFYADPQTVLADPVTGDVIGPVDDDSPAAAENAEAAGAAQPGEDPGDANRDSANSPGNLEDSAAADAPAAAAAGNAEDADGNPLLAADDSGDDAAADAAPVGEDPGAANRDPPGDAVVDVAPPPGDAVPEAAPAPGVPEAPEPGAPETAEAAAPPEAEAAGDGGASPAPEAPVAPGTEQQPEATAPPSPAPATDTDSPENTALTAATGTSEGQTRLSSTLASSLSDSSSSSSTDQSSLLSSSASTTQSTNSVTPTNSSEADSANSDSDDGTPTGAIVGGVVGGVLGAALLLLLVFMLLRWRKKRAGQMRLGDGAAAGAGAGAAATGRSLAAGGGDNGNSGGGAAGEMAEQSPSSPSSTGGGVLAAMATLNRSRSSPAGSQKSTERGFYRVSGKKLPSVIHHGGDGYSDPRRHSTISGASSGNTDSHGLEVEPGAAPKLALGQPMRPVSGVPVIRSSPARTPVEVEEGNPFSNPFDDPHPDPPTLPPGLNPDGVGRSLGAQDMSRGSRGSSSKFMEDL